MAYFFNFLLYLLIKPTKPANGVSDYKYPFTSSGDLDYIDYRILENSGNFLCPDFDTPVTTKLLPRKNGSPVVFPNLASNYTSSSPEVTNAQYNTMVPSSNFVSSQEYFVGVGILLTVCCWLVGWLVGCCYYSIWAKVDKNILGLEWVDIIIFFTNFECCFPLLSN